MKRITRLVLLSLGTLLCFTWLVIGQTAEFTAELSGKNEVPPVATPATGQATFQLSRDGNSLMYKLSVSHIADVTMAHIHVGAPGSNGEHVAFLYPVGMVGSMDEKEESMPTKKNDTSAPQKMTGVIAQGVIHGKDLVGPLKGKSIADLVAEIKAGKTYVNVHTKTHGDGEIRGHIQ